MNKFFTKENLESMKSRDMNRLNRYAEAVKHAAAVGAGELLVNEPELFDLAYPWFKYARDFAERMYHDAKDAIEFNYEVYGSSLDRTEAVEEVLRQNQTLIELLQKAVSNNSSDHSELLKLVSKEKK